MQHSCRRSLLGYLQGNNTTNTTNAQQGGTDKATKATYMGKINLVKRQKKELEERKRETNITNGMKAFQTGKFQSIRSTAEAYGLHYSTLSRRFKSIITYDLK